jgi:hypothetical protein
VPGVLLQAGIRKVGQQPVKLRSVTSAQPEFTLDGDSADWLITRFDAEPREAVFALTSIDEPLRIREEAGFYRRDGFGFLLAPVGPGKTAGAFSGSAHSPQ